MTVEVAKPGQGTDLSTLFQDPLAPKQKTEATGDFGSPEDKFADCVWRTINGAHVCINTKTGSIMKGPEHMVGKTPEEVGGKTPSLKPKSGKLPKVAGLPSIKQEPFDKLYSWGNTHTFSPSTASEHRRELAKDPDVGKLAEAVGWWTNGEYRSMGEAANMIVNGKESEIEPSSKAGKFKDEAKHMLAAIRMAPEKDFGGLTRYGSLDKAGKLARAGTKFEIRGLASFSKSSSNYSLSGDDIKIVVIGPTKGLPVMGISTHPNEAEVVLSGRFRVLRVDKGKYQKKIIYCKQEAVF